MNVDQMVSGAQDAMKAGIVYGQAIEKNGLTVLPAAKIRGGGGGGGDAENNGGGGFGLTAKPAGVYVIRGDTVKWEPAIDVNRIVLGAQITAIVALLAIRSIFKARARGR